MCPKFISNKRVFRENRSSNVRCFTVLLYQHSSHVCFGIKLNPDDIMMVNHMEDRSWSVVGVLNLRPRGS